MSKIYDKLVFIMALIVLGAGVGLYLSAVRSVSPQRAASETFAGGVWRTVPVPEIATIETVWPKAPEQSSGWIYDVFTPPKIYIAEDGKFSIVPIRDEMPEPPFELRLVKMERPLYRIQFEGHIEKKGPSDLDERWLLFYDVEAKKSLRLRPNGRSETSEFEVRSFRVGHNVDGGSFIRVATVVLFDWRDGREYEVIDKESLYRDEVEVVLRSNEDVSEIFLRSPGENFVTSSWQYVLDRIDFENKSVTVTRRATDDFDALTKLLQLENVASDVSSAGPAKTFEEPDAASVFDSLFQ